MGSALSEKAELLDDSNTGTYRHSCYVMTLLDVTIFADLRFAVGSMIVVIISNQHVQPIVSVCHYKHNPIQYRAAVTNLLDKAPSVYYRRILQLREGIGLDGMHDEMSELICDLQKVAVNSNQSLRRVAVEPGDHFFVPSSAEYYNSRESGPLQDETKERSIYLQNPPSISAHSVLGQILFDACVPKNVEGWDIRFSGTLNGQPIASAHRRHSPFHASDPFLWHDSVQAEQSQVAVQPDYEAPPRKAIMESRHVSVSGNANDFAIRSPESGSFIGLSFSIITISSRYTVPWSVCKTNLYILCPQCNKSLSGNTNDRRCVDPLPSSPVP
ncbi:hypothetical protein DKX38_006195 [Salix brachista]|uniref:Uncharacterized protein n=1 Tax=Salix brachista TaxID=2182728 RepID=A0A5N5N2L2_9ROSI|nr:hypothetical protein DKX38_006195 [Salix brachista]